MTNQSRVRSRVQAFHRSGAEAFDPGMNLWISVATLIIEATTYPLSHTLRSESFFPFPTTNTRGIGGDRNTIWHSRGFLPNGARQDLIYELDTDDFTEIRSAGAPEFEDGFWRPAGGIGGDADTIWFASHKTAAQTNGKIHELSTADLSEVRQSGPVPEGLNIGFLRITDVGGDANVIFTMIPGSQSSSSDTEVRKRDPSDFSLDVLFTIGANPGDQGLGGNSDEAYWADTTTLFEFDTTTLAIVRIDSFDGATIQSLGG